MKTVTGIEFHILRISLAITFLWIGILILQNPIGWGAYILPWAENLLPASIEVTMYGAGILDVIIGILLLLNIFTWATSLIAILHLVIILIVSGINAITVRDIGLIGALVALAIHARPTTHLDT